MCSKIRRIIINDNYLKYINKITYLFTLFIFADHIICSGGEVVSLRFCCHEHFAYHYKVSERWKVDCRSLLPHEDSPAVRRAEARGGWHPWWVSCSCKVSSSQLWSLDWAFPRQGLGLENSLGPHQTVVSCGPVIFSGANICSSLWC